MKDLFEKYPNLKSKTKITLIKTTNEYINNTYDAKISNYCINDF